MSYDLKNHFSFLAQYNQRANTELYDALSRLTEKARQRDCGSWFASLHGILNHVIVTDINWLKRYRVLSGNSLVLHHPLLDSPNLSWVHPLHQEFIALRQDRVIVDELIINWFTEFPEAQYSDIFEYTDSRGMVRQAKVCDAFNFLFVHQTHHRGQIAQVLDQLGIPNNVADNIRFLEF
jgi:uncharacterized damage-inducible protein DinB